MITAAVTNALRTASVSAASYDAGQLSIHTHFAVAWVAPELLDRVDHWSIIGTGFSGPSGLPRGLK
jgi:hypothetical protein